MKIQKHLYNQGSTGTAFLAGTGTGKVPGPEMRPGLGIRPGPGNTTGTGIRTGIITKKNDPLTFFDLIMYICIMAVGAVFQQLCYFSKFAYQSIGFLEYSTFDFIVKHSTVLLAWYLVIRIY